MTTYANARVTTRQTLLQDRTFLMATDPAPEILAAIDSEHGGLVASGAQRAKTVRALRALDPSIPILIEPDSASQHRATAEEPFLLDSEGLVPTSLRDVLTGQRACGASMAVTPSGQVFAADSAALKAIINTANEIDDDATLTLVPVADIWLTRPWVDQLEAVLLTSRHPVLLGVVNSNDDPLSRKDAVVGYARLAGEVPELIAWRADLSALGARAHGALAAVIGQRPSQRRYARAGETPFASDKSDKTPHVLLPTLMRYSRTSKMRREWFATSPSLTCGCNECRGRELDRFSESDASHTSAYLHNLAVLQEMAGDLTASADRVAWWTERMRDAGAAHLALGNQINRPVPEPTYIKRWLNQAPAR